MGFFGILYERCRELLTGSRGAGVGSVGARPPDGAAGDVADDGSVATAAAELEAAQIRIKQLTCELNCRTEEFQTLLDVLPVGIGIAHDVECRRITVNPYFARALGIEARQNASLSAPDDEKPSGFKVFQAGRELKPDEMPMQVAAAEGRTVSEAQIEIRREDGTVVTLLENVAPLFDAAGRPRGSVGAFVDISERNRTESEREALLASERQARGEAERLSRAKDEFVATLSHELRTPLTAILGWVHLLGSGKLNEHEAAHALSTIDRNARMQAQLVDDLLDMSRVISGKLRMEVGPVDLITIVASAIESLRPAANAKSITLHSMLDLHNTTVSGDSARLHQVVWNLLTNAVKFTPAGGTIAVCLETEGSNAKVVVSDTGQGIAPDFLPHVFEPFHQADASPTRRHGGLGLGLGIARRLVELHGGAIHAASEGVGKGAAFTVTLPLRAVETYDRTEPATILTSGDAFIAACPSLKGLDILVVDDEPDARDMVRRILEQCEATVRTAGSVAEAMEMVQAEPPGVLLSDIGMPDEDGYSLLHKIRALPPEAGGTVPALALTAFAHSDDRARALDNGYQMHLAKPIDPLTLAAAVATVAGRR